MKRPRSAHRFLKACRSGAPVEVVDRLHEELKRDYRMRRDAEAIANHALDVAEGAAPPAERADEIAYLLARARNLMEAV